LRQGLEGTKPSAVSRVDADQAAAPMSTVPEIYRSGLARVDGAAGHVSGSIKVYEDRLDESSLSCHALTQTRKGLWARLWGC
jgi:hypothetical protein